MTNKIKDAITLILVILIFLGFIFALGNGASNAGEYSNLRKQEKVDFAEECFNKGGRVDTVGNILEAYLVCNPI